MKRITYICAILLSSVLMFSCSDYLEAPPSVDLDEDGVFADRTLTEQYITGIYAEGMPLGFSMGSSGIDRKLCATSTLQERVMKPNKVQTGGRAMPRGTWTIITTAA